MCVVIECIPNCEQRVFGPFPNSNAASLWGFRNFIHGHWHWLDLIAPIGD